MAETATAASAAVKRPASAFGKCRRFVTPIIVFFRLLTFHLKKVYSDLSICKGVVLYHRSFVRIWRSVRFPRFTRLAVWLDLAFGMGPSKDNTVHFGRRTHNISRRVANPPQVDNLPHIAAALLMAFEAGNEGLQQPHCVRRVVDSAVAVVGHEQPVVSRFQLRLRPGGDRC